MTNNRRTYTVDSEVTPEEAGNARCRFVVTYNGSPVIETRSNGQSFHMTYATVAGAQNGATRARILGRLQGVEVADTRQGVLAV